MGERLMISARVMVSRLVGSRPASGSALMAWSLLGMLSLPLSAPPPLACTGSLSRKKTPKPKKMYRQQASTGKDAPHLISPGKRELNRRRDTSHTCQASQNPEPYDDQILVGMRASGSLICRRWECHTAQLLHKTVRPALPKRNILLPNVPPVTLLGIYPKEVKTYVHTKIRTQVFTAALDITDTRWKQAKCSSVGRCVHQLWDRPDNGILVTAKKKGATKPQKDIEET